MRNSAIIILAGFIFSTATPANDNSARTELISRVEVQYFSMSGITPESPVLNLMLSEARRLNPNVEEAAWGAIKSEVATEVVSAMTAKGAAMDAYFEAAVNNLSTPELRKLASILSDPIYIKFCKAMTNPDNQKRMLQGILIDPMAISRAINSVLERHGLNVPH